jgi:dolichol-phosphate mannosyltransferase
MIVDLGIGQISRRIDSSHGGEGPDLIVVMPIYNEEANISVVLREWAAALEEIVPRFTIVALNDGSRDRTSEILDVEEQSLGDRLCVVHKINSGHGLTCRMGYEVAVLTQASWVLQIDSDGQCDPSYFREFWDRHEAADCVFGERTSRDDGTARKMTSWICSTASSVLCRRDIGDANVPYRLMRSSALASALPHIPKGFNIHNVALTYVLKQLPDLRWEYVPIHFRDRQGGSNSIDILKVSKWGTEMLFELASLHPTKNPA